MDRRGIRSLKTRVGRECSISRRRARLYSGNICVGGILGESPSFASGDTVLPVGAASRVKAIKSSEFGEGILGAPLMDPYRAGAALH